MVKPNKLNIKGLIYILNVGFNQEVELIRFPDINIMIVVDLITNNDEANCRSEVSQLVQRCQGQMSPSVGGKPKRLLWTSEKSASLTGYLSVVLQHKVPGDAHF